MDSSISRGKWIEWKIADFRWKIADFRWKSAIFAGNRRFSREICDFRGKSAIFAGNGKWNIRFLIDQCGKWKNRPMGTAWRRALYRNEFRQIFLRFPIRYPDTEGGVRYSNTEGSHDSRPASYTLLDTSFKFSIRGSGGQV